MAIRMVGYNCGGSIGADGKYNDGGKIHIAKNKKGTFKAAATKAGESGPEFANKVLSAPEGEYSPALRKKANFARNFAYSNDGGPVVSPTQHLNSGGYSGKYGGANHRPYATNIRANEIDQSAVYPNERAANDEWRARLYAVSENVDPPDPLYDHHPKPHRNWYDPRGWVGLNDGGDVPRYGKDGELLNGPYDRSGPEFDTVPTMLSEGEFVVNAASAHKFAPVLKKINDWKVGEKTPAIQHLNEGGASKATTDSRAATLRLLNNADARKNARKAAQSRVSAARLNGGIQSLGAAFDNATAQAQSAGFRTNSLGSVGPNGYTPANFSSNSPADTNFGRQFQPIGQGEQTAANAQSDYYNKLQGINDTETNQIIEEENRLRDEQTTANDSIRYATAAIEELNKGAGRVLNFATSKVVNNLITAQGVGAGKFSGPQNLNVNQFIGEEKKNAPVYYFGADSPEMTSYSRLLSYLSDLKVAARGRLKGQGAISEGESQVVYDTVANLEIGSDAAAAALQTFIDKVAYTAKIQAPVVPYTSVPAFTKDIKGEDIFGDSFEGLKDTVSGIVDNVKGVVGGKADDLTTKATDLIDKTKGKFSPNNYKGWK